MPVRLLIGLVVLLLAALSPAANSQALAAVESCPAPPEPQVMENPAFYRYVHTYSSACASQRNWDRSFADVTVSRLVDGRNRLSVTASTALGGALASLRVNDKEFLASGGHGSALQWAFHAWNGPTASECYNPTQAGSRRDDAGPPPYHGPSTSALYEQAATGAASIRTTSRLAMYIPLSMTTPGYGGCYARDYQPDRSPYSLGLSPYWLNTTVQLGPETGLTNLDNVVRLAARLTSEDARYEHFDGVLVAYLQRDFTITFHYDPATRTLTRRSGSFSSASPVLRCTADQAYCLGAYFRRSVMPTAYYWVQTDAASGYNGLSGTYVEQVTVPASGVGGTGRRRLTYEVYLAVGNLTRVTATLQAIDSQLSRPDPPAPEPLSAVSAETPAAPSAAPTATSSATTAITNAPTVPAEPTTARAAPVAAARPSTDLLPFTGTGMIPLLVSIAASLVIAGGLAVHATRRRAPTAKRRGPRLLRG